MNANLEAAEQYGALLFTEEEVKLILTKEPNNIENAILKGQLLTEATIRKVIIEQAKNGSSEAQKIVLKWQLKINLRRIR